MSSAFCVLLAQINPRLGDITANLVRIEQCVEKARQQADLLLFPEMALTGYALQDTLLYPQLQLDVKQAVEHLASLSQNCPFILGLPWWSEGKIFNSCALFQDGKMQALYHKRRLQQDTLFDEPRYFACGQADALFSMQGVRIGLALGEEIACPAHQQHLQQLAPDLIVNLAADPFYLERPKIREQQQSQTAHMLKRPLIFVNSCGGQDEWVYDGHSSVFSAHGDTVVRCQGFTEQEQLVEFSRQAHTLQPATMQVTPHLTQEATVYQALQMSLYDYATRCGFNRVILGLSGGIDSALVLAIAVDALGADKVNAVMMPYHYTAQISQDDAEQQARQQGVSYHILPIAPVVEQYQQTLSPLLQQFTNNTEDTTEQNLQARTRGALLMALSNRSGALIITTGNKSEMAVGYCTLYGDMAGGFALLKDIPKTLVYRLARYRNSLSPTIPERVITRAPSAELAPNQKDNDSLPPYEILDEIVRLYVEENYSAAQIIAQGLQTQTVQHIIRLIDLNEYKRHQAAIGPRITKRGFGHERRMPITKKPGL